MASPPRAGDELNELAVCAALSDRYGNDHWDNADNFDSRLGFFCVCVCVCVRVCVCVCCKPPTKASTLAEAMEEKEKSERKKRPERKKSSATAATCRFITRLASLNF